MSRYEWNSKYILKTDNANLVVSLSDMKLYLKVDSSADDALITGLIKTATKLSERYTRREFLTKTFTMFLDFFPVYRQYGNTLEGNFDSGTIQVKRSLLQSIASIKYFTNEVLTTLDSSLYDFSQDNNYSRIYLIDNSTVWPQTDTRKQTVEIEFDAGYGATEADVPEELKTAIKIIVAYLYENRGDCVNINLLSQISGAGQISISGAQLLLDLYKILEI